MRDETAEELLRRTALTHEMLSEMRLFGFRQISTPVLEKRELFVRGLGSESDAVSKELYTVDEETALRPENTAGAVRMFVEGAHDLCLPVRWSYDGEMFRRERPQRGRWRQFRQIGAELFSGGSAEVRVAGDVELIAIAKRALGRAIGAHRFDREIVLQINTLGDAESRKAYSTVLRDYLESKRSSLSQEGVARLDRGALLRVLDSKQDKEIAVSAPRIFDSLNDRSKKYWSAVKDGLKGLNITFEESSSLVRGLDYYQDTVFEFVHTGETLGVQQATVLAGGRYDGLVHQTAKEFRGSSVPFTVSGAGWAAGVDRLLLLRDDAQDDQEDVISILSLIGENDPQSWKGALVANRLAEENLASETIAGSSLRKVLAECNRRKRQFALLLGSDEMALWPSKVVLRDMKSGQQTQLTWQELISKIKK